MSCVIEDEPQPPDGAGPEQNPREGQPSRPLLRVVKGDATPEEVAALVAVVAALGSGDDPPARRTPEWSAHHRKVRRTLPARPGRLAAQLLPR